MYRVSAKQKAGKVWVAWKSLSPQTRCVSVFATFNFAVAVLGFALHADYPYFPCYALAKSAGYMLDLNMTLILFPVMRNFMSFLRMTPLVEVVPMDDHILFHKLVRAHRPSSAAERMSSPTLQTLQDPWVQDGSAFEAPDWKAPCRWVGWRRALLCCTWPCTMW